jgi:hypothetical protein
VSAALDLLPQRTVVRRHVEDDLQRDVCKFLALALPPDACFMHIPNGGLRSKKAAARLAGLGVLRGAPDLLVVHRGRAAFIELKAPKGTQSPAQRSVARKLIYCGAEVMLCRSLGQVEASLRECGVPLRASVVP